MSDYVMLWAIMAFENVYVSGPGCKACGYKGFKGRMAVDEIILPDSRFLRLMIDNETAKAIDYWVSELNGRPLKDAAIERMIKGQIDMDEVERWCGLLTNVRYTRGTTYG